jgi:hypothetical protein
VCLIVPIKKIGEYDDDDAAGRLMGGAGTQATEAKEANGGGEGSANANDANANEAQS